MDKIKVLHANSNTLVRAGLKALLQKGGGIDSVIDAEDNDDLFDILKTNKPDILVIDFDQPGMFTGTDVFKIRRDYPNLKILIISTDEQHSKILSIIETGVQGYLTRECDEDEIVSNLRSTTCSRLSSKDKIPSVH